MMNIVTTQQLIDATLKCGLQQQELIRLGIPNSSFHQRKSKNPDAPIPASWWKVAEPIMLAAAALDAAQADDAEAARDYAPGDTIEIADVVDVGDDVADVAEDADAGDDADVADDDEIDADAGDAGDTDADDDDTTGADADADGDDADDELAARERANQERRGGGNAFIGKSVEELLAAAEKLAAPPLNDKGKPRALTAPEKADRTATLIDIARAAMVMPGGVPATLKAVLLGSIEKALKCGKRAAGAIWDEALLAHAKANAPTPEQQAAEQKAREEAEAAAAEKARLAEIAELEAEVAHIMRDENLIENTVKLAQDEGVVGEEHSVVVSVLVGTSRVKKNRAMALARLGPPSSGKNFVSDIVLKLMPPGSVIRVSGTSQKALYYMGGEDPDALKHKIIYITEAAVIASKGGIEHEFTAALRSLLSDDILVYQVADGEAKDVITITKNGPIALIMTSARENIEDELKTRLIEDYADESVETTRAVQRAIARKLAGGAPSRTSPYTVAQMQKYQRLLELTGPHDVVIPFAGAVARVWERLPAIVRTRRDTTQIFSATQAAAILRAYQRERDGQGRIIAELDDYRVAFNACDAGISAVYRPDVGAEVIALVKLFEAMLKARVDEATIALTEWKRVNDAKPERERQGELDAPQIPERLVASYEQIRQAMGVASKDTVAGRVRKALAAEVIERTDERSFSSLGRPKSEWTIKVPSAQLEADAAGVQGLPTPDDVARALEIERDLGF